MKNEQEDLPHIEVSRTDLRKRVLPDDEYPLFHAAQRIRDEAEDTYIDADLFRIIDHPEAEDFAIEGWIEPCLSG